MASEPIEPICVFCGYRDAIDGDACRQCSEQKLVDDYWQEDQEAIATRRDQWKARSTSTLAQRERQHRSRLLRATRPAERPHAFSDPLEIAMTALQACARIRQAVRSNVNARERLDEVEEALKELAWGPVSAEELRKDPRGEPAGDPAPDTAADPSSANGAHIA